MTHNMKLNGIPFEKIKNGSKTIMINIINGDKLWTVEIHYEFEGLI